MSLYTTPLLYLGMGGEMLYVLQERLRAQKIAADKCIQVMNDVTIELLSLKNLSKVFEKSLSMDYTLIRSILEKVVLSSIMKLSQNSMDKLFDLMNMMLKYQMTASTGPREVILIILNHIDGMREMVTDERAHQCVNLVHQNVVDVYSNLTNEEVWQARNDCLKILRPFNVRLTILLKLGIQNQDATFNIFSQNYDEEYEKRRKDIGQCKLGDIVCMKYATGSFNLSGDRVTLLGTNLYSSTNNNIHMKRTSELLHSDSVSRAEIEMLALQLGTEETIYGNSSDSLLHWYGNNMNSVGQIGKDQEHGNIEREECNMNREYKSRLENMYADVEDETRGMRRSLELLDVLNQV